MIQELEEQQTSRVEERMLNDQPEDQPARRCGRLEKLGAWIPYFSFLRIVIFASLFIAGLPLTLFTPAASLVRGVFDIDALGIFFVTLTVSISVLSLLVITLLIVINGGERFESPLGSSNGDDIATSARINPPKIWLRFLFALIAMPIIVTIFLLSTSWWGFKILAILSGVIVAFILSQLALMLYFWLIPADVAETSPTSIEAIISIGIGSLFEHAKKANKSGCIYKWLLKRVPRVPRWIGRGYFSYPDKATNTIGMLYPGHAMSLVMMILTGLVYLGMWGLGGKNWTIALRVPALAYGLVLVVMLCWLLSSLAFLLDRYRWPLLRLLIIWGFLTSWIPLWSPLSDYYYPVVPRTSNISIMPEEVVGDNSTIIVVAANGGGIQSAAWTAQVLTGLEQQSRAEFGADFRKFGKSIRFISSVSGGSVGAMYFANAYTPAGLPDNQSLRHVVDQAATSSLDDVVWGMAYPDFMRTIIPNPLIRTDRGRALEAAWLRADDRLSNALSSWREGVSAGWRPATAFNATIADTGERLLFSTTDFGSALAGGQVFSGFVPYSEHAVGYYPNYDVPIVTAARLSATFPYVTPAARAEFGGSERPSFHVVDGGYYDNYGMVTLVEWLDQALRHSNGRIKKVLVLQIKGAPSGTDPQYRFRENAAPGECPQRSEPQYMRENERGWFYQTFAPLATMLHVRNTGQIAHNDTEFDLLQRAWRGEVEISTAVFQYYGADAPLSWHLTQQQKDDIRRDWAAHLNNCYSRNEWNTVKKFLADVK